MIAIVNLTGNLTGTNIYEIRINNKHITSFRHVREEGLSKCLKLASEAVMAKEFTSQKLEFFERKD